MAAASSTPVSRGIIRSARTRGARWLLQVDERVNEAPFEVTQEFLAEMIGVQRPSLSLAVQQLNARGPDRVVARAREDCRPATACSRVPAAASASTPRRLASEAQPERYDLSAS